MSLPPPPPPPPPSLPTADAEKPVSSLSNSIHDTEGRLKRLLKDDTDLNLWLQHTRYFDLGHREQVLGNIRKLKAVEEEREKLILQLQLAQTPSSPLTSRHHISTSTGSVTDDAGSVADDDVVATAASPSSSKQAKTVTDTRFFLVKCFNTANIYMSQRDGLWVTQTKNGDVFSQAFKECQSVILFFSINKSRGFQGFARMTSVPDAALPRPEWIQRINLKSATAPFRVEWINTAVTEFDQVGDLKNSLNEFRSVVVGRDGQEYPPECGLKMMALLSQAAIKPCYAAAAASSSSAVAAAAATPVTTIPPRRLPSTGRSSIASLHNPSPGASSPAAVAPPPSSRPWRASRHRGSSPTPLPAAASVPSSSSVDQRNHPNLIDC